MITILPIAQDIICLIAKIEDLPVIEPDPLEECFISRAVEKRKIEFRAGRNLARLALKHLGNDAITIPARENRLPDWPDGFIGSLSHTRSHVGVVVAKSSSFQSIGFDIENLRSIETSLYPHLLRKEEIAEVQREDIDPTVYFSGKEAAFKAVFQVHEEYFEFTDLRLLLQADTFQAFCAKESLLSSQPINLGRGLLRRHQGHIVSLFLVPWIYD